MGGESLWRGTSDGPVVARARAAGSTPGQRLAWLEESLLLARASGALAQDRARRQRRADTWTTGSRLAGEHIQQMLVKENPGYTEWQ